MALSADQKIKIIYEDNNILILDKPAGWVTTRENDKLLISNFKKNEVKYIEDWIGENRPNNLPRKGIVHRLDKGTSGVLVVAKDVDSLIKLKAQFKKRQIVKHYLALVAGDLPTDGNIKMPIIRSNYTFTKFKVGEDGRTAETEFRLLKKIKIENRIYSLIYINLKTGRTHQIRVHFSYLGWPLLGDRTYGGKEILGLERPFLHACNLTLEHPISGKIITFESPMSNELKKIIDNYE